MAEKGNQYVTPSTYIMKPRKSLLPINVNEQTRRTSAKLLNLHRFSSIKAGEACTVSDLMKQSTPELALFNIRISAANGSVYTALAVLLTAVSAKAQTDFAFSDIGNDFSLSGVIGGTPNGDGSYTITSGSATFSSTSDRFAGLTAAVVPNPSGSQPYVNYALDVEYDNQAQPNQSPAVDRVGGLLFTLNSNGTQYYINPYDIGGQDMTFIAANGSAISYPSAEQVTTDYGQNVMEVQKVSITSIIGGPANVPGAPAPPMTACLAFAAVLVLQALRSSTRSVQKIIRSYRETD